MTSDTVPYLALPIPPLNPEGYLAWLSEAVAASEPMSLDKWCCFSGMPPESGRREVLLMAAWARKEWRMARRRKILLAQAVRRGRPLVRNRGGSLGSESGATGQAIGD